MRGKFDGKVSFLIVINSLCGYLLNMLLVLKVRLF